MTAPTPGAYIKMRRCAAGFSVADVAARLQAEPHIDERGRVEWLELIEADAQPCALATIVALRRIFPFDLDVLVALERIAQGSTETPPMICRICGCSELDACDEGFGHGCAWVEPGLCSCCTGRAKNDALEAAA